MALPCNIDRRGRIARLVYGVALLALAVALALRWAVHEGTMTSWVITSSCAAAGGFGIFESLKGWCVMRAMGFKTRM